MLALSLTSLQLQLARRPCRGARDDLVGQRGPRRDATNEHHARWHTHRGSAERQELHFCVRVPLQGYLAALKLTTGIDACTVPDTKS